MDRKTSLLGKKLGGGRYEIIELFGKGSFAEVYRARQITLQRDVAIKILNETASEDADLVRRFHREAEAIAQFDHPHIVKIFDHGSEGGIHYYVMNLLPRTLRALLKARRPLPLEITLQIARQVTSALAYAQHTIKNFMHRDIKPENVMLDASHNAILSDFGLVRGDQMARLTVGNLVMGTPIYMSPEQIRGFALDQRSDLYALGVLLYECATGSPPFLGEIMSICHHHVSDPPPAIKLKNPELPHAVEALILRLLEKEPERRFQSAAELLAALEALPLELRQPKTSIYSQPTLPVPRETSGETPSPKTSKAHATPPPMRVPTAKQKSMLPVYAFVAVSAVAFSVALFSYFKKEPARVVPPAATNHKANAESTLVPPRATLPVWGQLEVTSIPAGATIALNGRAFKQKTPVRIDSLPSGVYEVQMTLPNYRPHVETIRVTSGHTETLARTLVTLVAAPPNVPAPEKISYTIISDPPSEIIIDGESFGKPANGLVRAALTPGTHRVQFRLPPYPVLTRQIHASATETSFELKWFGRVRVQAFDENGDPEFGAVFLDSMNTGQLSDGTVWDAPAGEYAVIVKRNGFEMRDAPPKIVVRGGEVARVPPIYLKRRIQ